MSNETNSQHNGYNLISYSKQLNKQSFGFDSILQLETKNQNSIYQRLLQNFKWLEQNSLDNQRIISNLDFYRITDTVNADNIETVFNNMIRNSSAIVTENCTLNGKDYTVGDLVYKQTNGEAQRLFLSGGVYYPELSINQVKWIYSSQAASNDDHPKLSYTWSMEAAKSLTYGNIFTSEWWSCKLYEYPNEEDQEKAQKEDKYLIHQFYCEEYLPAKEQDKKNNTKWREENMWYKLLYGVERYNTHGELKSETQISDEKAKLPEIEKAYHKRIFLFFKYVYNTERMFRDAILETDIFTHSFSEISSATKYPTGAPLFNLYEQNYWKLDIGVDITHKKELYQQKSDTSLNTAVVSIIPVVKGYYYKGIKTEGKIEINQNRKEEVYWDYILQKETISVSSQETEDHWFLLMDKNSVPVILEQVVIK